MAKKDDILQACKLFVVANKGISLEEEVVLSKLPKINDQHMTAAELVVLAVGTIKRTLQRSNITPRDLKKATIRLIQF